MDTWERRQASRVIRVFISSTFSDFKAERNALQRLVFPRLHGWCEQRGWRFQAIDLRWGVSTDAAMAHGAMRICRAEIERCQRVTPRPNFIVLLGDRYGWRPLPDEIAASEFDRVLSRLAAPERALAAEWYRLDGNAVPLDPDGRADAGAYILQPRAGRFAGEAWTRDVEGPLGAAFRRAVRELDLPAPLRMKYQASATEQEVHAGAFAVPDAREHVCAFFREIRGDDGRSVAASPLRDPTIRDFLDLGPDGAVDAGARRRLEALKSGLEARLAPALVRRYVARWEPAGPSEDHLPRFCDDVYAALERLIAGQMDAYGMDPDDEERAAHAEVAFERSRAFVGRDEVMQAIQAWRLSPGPALPLVLRGDAGCGKSAVLAKAALAAAGERRDGTQVIVRFIGATAHSTDLRALVTALCSDAAAAPGENGADLPVELATLTDVLRQRWADASAARPLLVVLDGLDRLALATPADLRWLCQPLPQSVRLLASAAPGATLNWLQEMLSDRAFLDVPPLGPAECEALMSEWLGAAQRRLTPAQLDALREGFAGCGLPLYVRLAFEEARHWRSDADPPPMAIGVEGLAWRLFDRLRAGSGHGPLLVDRVTGFLCCSRHGVTEDEVTALLARDPEYRQSFLDEAHHDLPDEGEGQGRRLPVVVWLRLYYDLAPYLVWRQAFGDALMSFAHAALRDVAEQALRERGDDLARRHGQLAAFYQAQADRRAAATGWPLGNAPCPSCRTSRRWLACGRRWYQTLTSPSFLEARFPGAAAAPASDEEHRRVRVEDLHALIADIDMVRRQMPDTA